MREEVGFCAHDCTVVWSAHGSGAIKSARLIAESRGGTWRLGTGVPALFDIEITTAAGKFVARGVSAQEGLRETYAEGASPRHFRIRKLGGVERVVATFGEQVSGSRGYQANWRVLVVCGLGTAGTPACYVLNDGALLPSGDLEVGPPNARRRFTPTFR